jgi:hypothetical protein
LFVVPTSQTYPAYCVFFSFSFTAEFLWHTWLIRTVSFLSTILLFLSLTHSLQQVWLIIYIYIYFSSFLSYSRKDRRNSLHWFFFFSPWFYWTAWSSHSSLLLLLLFFFETTYKSPICLIFFPCPRFYAPFLFFSFGHK